MDKPLTGKLAVVTGAGRGIGRSIALTFARSGADLVICARSQEQLDEVELEVEALGQKCATSAIDMGDVHAVENFCSKVKRACGSVDILVNNAGVYTEWGKFEDSDPEEWWNTFEINVRGPYLMTRLLLDAMPAGAKIMNLNSGKGYSAGLNSTSYHASKAALRSMTEGLANELWEKEIEVNTIIPGPTATTTLSRQDPRAGIKTEDILEKFTNEPPAGLPKWERVKHPDEVAEFALQLACYPIGGPTGQVFSLARRPL